MTKLILDPAILPLQYPRASSIRPKKIRLVAQVHRYDVQCGHLFLSRIPNLPPLHTQITLDDEPSPEKPVAVDVAGVAQNLAPETTDPGSIVSIWGFYNGAIISAVECCPVNGQELLGGSAEVLAGISSLGDL